MQSNKDREIERLCRIMCGVDSSTNDAIDMPPVVYSRPTKKDAFYCIRMAIKLLPAIGVISLSLVIASFLLFDIQESSKPINKVFNFGTRTRPEIEHKIGNGKNDVSEIKRNGLNN